MEFSALPSYSYSIPSCAAKCDDPVGLDGLGCRLCDVDVLGGEARRCELLSGVFSLSAAALAALEVRLAACASVARPIMAPTPLTSFSAIFFESWAFLFKKQRRSKRTLFVLFRKCLV